MKLSYFNLLTSLIIGSLWLILTPETVLSDRQADSQKPHHSSEENRPQSNNSSSEQLDFSHSGNPNGQTDGASRGTCYDPSLVTRIRSQNRESRNNNQENKSPTSSYVLTALVPQRSGYTISQYPDFFVYIPEHSNNIKKVEFIVQNEEGTQEFIRLPLQSPNLSGMLKIRSPHPLQINQTYRWFLNMTCQNEAKIIVEGYITRIQRDSANSVLPKYQSYLIEQLWYDALADVIQRYSSSSEHPVIQQEWQQLLSAKGVNLEGKIPPHFVLREAEFKPASNPTTN